MNRALFALPIVLLAFLSLSKNGSDKLRSSLVSLQPPLTKVSSEGQALQLENYQLRAQLDLVYEWLGSDKQLRAQMDSFRLLGKEPPTEFLKRRGAEMKSLLQKQMMAAHSRIIYRDPSSWSSSCWVDVGEENNVALGQPIIAKNSPVVSGSALVGIIEYVGKRQSRVRLITDAGLKTAVRAVRGSVLDREVALLTQTLIDRLKKHPQLKTEGLMELQQSLTVGWEDGFFAKGELSGSSAPYFRTLKSTLKGAGFNCDFKDAEGPARDLRSGILQQGDLLVTSGLDGVFPPGLKVAIVTKIESLRAGAFAYSLEAEPVAGDLSDLTSVYILPPVAVE